MYLSGVTAVPTEFRHIIFSHEETLAAIVEYRKRTSDALPSGNVIKFVVSEDPEIRVDMVIDPDRVRGHRRVAVYRDDLATALIMYCIDRRIPMPIKSNKFLQVFNGNIGLVITKNVTAGQPGNAP